MIENDAIKWRASTFHGPFLRLEWSAITFLPTPLGALPLDLV
jgi:hypothetical protein